MYRPTYVGNIYQIIIPTTPPKNVLNMREVRPKTVSPLNRLRVVCPRTLKVIVKLEFLNMTGNKKKELTLPKQIDWLGTGSAGNILSIYGQKLTYCDLHASGQIRR